MRATVQLPGLVGVGSAAARAGSAAGADLLPPRARGVPEHELGRQPQLDRFLVMPLTRVACVSRVYTDHAVFLIEARGVVVRDRFGVSFEELQALVDLPLLQSSPASPAEA